MPKQVSLMGHKEFIALMAILMSVVAIAIDALLPALGIIGRDLQISHPNQAQYVISTIFIGLALGRLISGPLSNAIVGATSSILGIVLGTIIGQLYDGTLNPLMLGFLVLGSLAFMMMYVEKAVNARQQSSDLAEEQAS